MALAKLGRKLFSLSRYDGRQQNKSALAPPNFYASMLSHLL